MSVRKKGKNLSLRLVCIVEDVSPIFLAQDMTRKEHKQETTGTLEVLLRKDKKRSLCLKLRDNKQ